MKSAESESELAKSSPAASSPAASSPAASSPATSRSALIGVIVAVILLLGVGFYAVIATSGIGDVQMSGAGWAAMVFGIILTLGLGFGLMSLVFISNRRGYDERGDPRR